MNWYKIGYNGAECKVSLSGHLASKYAVMRACNALRIEYDPAMALRFRGRGGFADPNLPIPANATLVLTLNEEFASNLEYIVFTVHIDTLENPGVDIFVAASAKVAEILYCYGLAIKTKLQFALWHVITSAGEANLEGRVNRIHDSDIILTQHDNVRYGPLVEDSAVQITIPTSEPTCTVKVSHADEKYIVQIPSTVPIGDIAFLIGLEDPFNVSFISLTSKRRIYGSVLAGDLPADEEFAINT